LSNANDSAPAFPPPAPHPFSKAPQVLRGMQFDGKKSDKAK
jgi:hypothetical protein